MELPWAHPPVCLTGCRRAVDNAPAWLFQVLGPYHTFPVLCISLEEAGRAGPNFRGTTGSPSSSLPVLPSALFLAGVAQVSPRLPQVHSGGGAAAGCPHLQGQV